MVKGRRRGRGWLGRKSSRNTHAAISLAVIARAVRRFIEWRLGVNAPQKARSKA